MLAELCEGSGELALAAELHGFCKDCVRIVVVKNHDVIGAAAGGVRETTGLVVEKSDGNGHHSGKHTMGSYIGIDRYGQRSHAVWWRNGG